MRRIKKISKQGQITFNRTELTHIECQPGNLIIIDTDEGRHGHFISIYPPDPKKHATLLSRYMAETQLDSDVTEEKEDENETT